MNSQAFDTLLHWNKERAARIAKLEEQNRKLVAALKGLVELCRLTMARNRVPEAIRGIDTGQFLIDAEQAIADAENEAETGA